ncbi:MAG: class I SAM-dependent methyltransferase [Verrucomicrobiales bacterium]|nr:class I SAM-dependent methyltransferase [Verrucomicrobiales bacterium]
MNSNFSYGFGCNWPQARWLLPLLRQHAEAASGTILDLGCGASPFRSLFLKADRYVRVDCYKVDDEVIVADATSLPFETASINVIILSQVLGDIPDLVKAFREMERVLAPDGSLLVYETMTYPQHDLPHDYWRVMPHGLRWAARQAGLEVHAIDHLGGYFTQLSQHWNLFCMGSLARFWFLRPIAAFGRLCGNFLFAGLDRILPRNDLASDYFACIRKQPHNLNKGNIAKS